MRWIYLSPHFDDVVLSCGGMAWEQVRDGAVVEFWTVCAGTPDPAQPLSPFAQSLHQRWQTGPQAVNARAVEDAAAAEVLGAATRIWDLPDCIYRSLPQGGWLVNGEEDLWQPVHPQERQVVQKLTAWLADGVAGGDVRDAVLVSPLTLGSHVDHRLTRLAAEQAAAQVGVALRYYPDYPYVVGARGEASSVLGEAWQQESYPVSPQGLRMWQTAIACYTSQLSTFWPDLAAMEEAIAAYWQAGGGSYLWKPSSFGKIEDNSP